MTKAIADLPSIWCCDYKVIPLRLDGAQNGHTYLAFARISGFLELPQDDVALSVRRVQSLYEVMDSAYDAESIHSHSRGLGRVPLIAPNGRNSARKPANLSKVFPPKPGRQFAWSEHDRSGKRTMVERVYTRLNDEFGASQIRVRGANKVTAHVSFGTLALTVD